LSDVNRSRLQMIMPSCLLVGSIVIVGGWLVLVGAWLHSTNAIAVDNQSHWKSVSDDIGSNRRLLEENYGHMNKQDEQLQHIRDDIRRLNNQIRKMLQPTGKEGVQ